MSKLKIYKLILCILIVAAIIVGTIITVKGIRIYINESNIKELIDSIQEQIIDENVSEIDAEMDGYKVIRNNIDTKN